MEIIFTLAGAIFFIYVIVKISDFATDNKNKKLQKAQELAQKEQKEKELIEKKLENTRLGNLIREKAQNAAEKYYNATINLINIFGKESFLDYQDLLQNITCLMKKCPSLIEFFPKTYNYEDLSRHYNDSLDFSIEIKNFCSLLCEKEGVPENEEFQWLFTYFVLRQNIIFCFYKLWIEYYGELKENTVVEYCNIFEINCEKEQNISLFAYYLYYKKADYFTSYSDVYAYVRSKVSEYIKKKKIQNFENKIFAENEKNISNLELKSYTIDEVDFMSGIEFENLIAEIFQQKGYLVSTTKISGDQGIDVIVEKDGKKTGIQAKCYSGVVGNKAIQEAVAGKNYYRLDKVMVLTNNYFSSSARDLAKVNEVILWDRDLLKEKLN